MKKHLFSILASFFLLTLLFPLTANAVRAPAPHPSAHCVCGGNHRNINGHTAEEVVYFTKDGTGNTSGDISEMNAIKSQEDFSTINFNFTNNKGKTFYGYLANDVTITKQLNIADGCTLVLCLHGHTLTCNVPDVYGAFNLWNNARLVITDCQYSGDRGLITGDTYAAVYVPRTSTFELYGVGICMTSSETDGIYDRIQTPVCAVYNGGTFNMYGGCPYVKSDAYPTDRPVISNIRNTKYGPAVANVGTFNMYDGIISGNERHGVMSTITNENSDDTINLYGGTITGNTGAGISTSHWPLYTGAESKSYTTVNLYGGTISENTGAGIDAVYGKVTMAQQSSAIPVEIKNNKGGAITLTKNGSTAKLGTGTITGNSGGKGAVALSAGSLTLTGNVKITGNTGANLYLASGKTVTLDNLGSSAEIGLTTESTAVPVVFAEANGTDYTSRFTPDSAGYSIGYNAAQQLQLQTRTYTVTYNPGANGTGDRTTVNKEYDKALELQGALFTRLGYTQVGWSKVDGGEMDYSLNAIYEQNEELTLYPVWEERSDYTVHIVNRDGTTLADFENVKWTDEIWKLLTPRPTRENGEILQRLLLGTKRVTGGDTYGKFATSGEDSLTFIAVWDGTFANRSTISVGDSHWTGYRTDGAERFFRDDQTVELTVPHPEELLYFRYAVSDQLFENDSVAASKLRNDFVDYTGTFSTASLNLEEGKPYVIYGYLFTEVDREIVINTDKIIIDKTAPVISGVKDGDVFCDAESKTITVTDLYLDTVTVNGAAVTPNDKGEITLSAGTDPQTVIAADKAGNSTKLTVTVHATHSYQWKTENGQYWGECESCGSKTERKTIPELTITSPDTVCRTQDFTFSFRLPEGCTDPSYSYEFTYAGDGEPVTPADGICTGTIPADSYQKGESSFRFIASVSTAEGYRVSADKTISIQEQHSGGTATCTEQAICDTCKQPYGDLLPHDLTAETADSKYLKTDVTCTDSAVYYKSCTACGISAKGLDEDAVFSSGEPLGHDYGKWTSNQDGTHSRTCSHDAAHIETNPCSGGTATCLESAICEVCGTGYGEMDPDHHTGTAEWITTEETHKQAYTCCGAVIVAEGPHVYDDDKDATCNDCGFNREIPHDHTYDGWSTDAENHWRACTDPDCPDPTGSILDKAAHVYDNDRDAICNICGYERTIPHEHTYGAWTTDAENHWHVCTDPNCPDPTGSIQDKAAHIYTNDQDATCNICGYQRTIVTPVVNPFKDVKESDWCYDDIMYVYEQGLMVGTNSDTFSPNLSLTRGMMATIIWRMEGSPAPTAAASFRDVPSGMWCADAIAWTAENSIFLGYGDHSFKPNEKITRQQLVTILYRYTDYLGEDVTASGDLSGFRDTDQLASWAETPMRWAVGTGLIRGKTATTLDPRSSATRAQVAAILHRFLS